MLVAILLFITSLAFFFFSYFFTDFAIVLMLAQTKPELSVLLDYIHIRDLNPDSFAYLYILLIICLFLIQLVFLRTSYQFILSKKVWVIFGLSILIFSLSYPFLSRDIFSHLFTAKIFWYYHLNPYVVSPAQISNDLWGSPVHNVDNVYQYPVVSLIYSLIPMVLFSGERFLLNYFGFKFLNAVVFFLSGVFLYKMTGQGKKIFSIWFFNPFLIVELLINAHNDMVMIGLFFLSLWLFLEKKNYFLGFLVFAASVFTKYFSLIGIAAIIAGLFKRKYLNPSFAALSVFSFIFLLFRGNNIWYFTWMYMFLPFLKLKNSSWVLIHLIGLVLLLRYLPFIQSGNWEAPNLINLPAYTLHILFIIILINELLVYKKFLKKSASSFFK